MAGFTVFHSVPPLQHRTRAEHVQEKYLEELEAVKVPMFGVLTTCFQLQVASKSRALGGEVSARGQGREDSVRKTWSGQVGLVEFEDFLLVRQ